MPYVGKNGSDAIFKAFSRICIVITKYHAKLDAAIDQAETDGVITSGQAAALHTFVDGAVATCALWGLVAGNSGF